jgi:hypothetical protein
MTVQRKTASAQIKELVHFEQKKAGRSGVRPSILESSTGATSVSGGDGIEVVPDSAKAEAEQFLFLPLEAIHDITPDIQGVLGQEFLSRFDYTLDLKGKRLEFGK